MEVWQHLLILLISASGLFIGGFIQQYTKKEVSYAKDWIMRGAEFLALCIVLLILYERQVGFLYFAVAILLFAYIMFFRKQSPEIYKKTGTAIGTYILYSIFYYYGAQSQFMLAIVSIIFIKGLLVGSLMTLKRKQTMAYCVLVYVLLGLLFTVFL